MVNKKPSTAAENRRQAVSQDFSKSGATYNLLTKRGWSSYKDLEIAVNKLGSDEGHWDIKFNTNPYTPGKGWQNYLMDNNVEGTDKDDGKAEKKADDEVDARIGGVVYVWAKATIQYYNDKAKTLTDNAEKKQVGDDLDAYINSHNTTNEQVVYNDTGIQTLIQEIKVEAAKGGGTTPPTPPGAGGEDFKNCGMGQRYYGDADLESVGFCMRYLKTS